MAGTPRSPSSDPPSKFSVKESQGFSHLRHLLLGPEQSQLERLASRLDSFTLQPHEIGRVLPDAIRLRAKQDDRLLASMVPVTQQAFARSIKESPQLISDTMAPIVGAAVRKAMRQAMRTMMQSLNQTLDHSMSWRGLQWRWEAFRTGKSFSEVVLLHTLRFRVEQVFLIHQKSGLLLNHVIADGVPGQGEDVISGMLTAIQDFVRDSFGETAGEGLESLRVGNLTVWIEQGSSAIVAGVIRGTPPLELRRIFQETSELIHAEYSEALQTFQGDASVFKDANRYLEECLQAQFEKSRAGLPWIIWIFMGTLLVLLMMWIFQSHDKEQRWESFLDRVRNVPGIVITSAQENESGTVFYGMRDPLSQDPEELSTEAGYSPQQVSFQLEPFLDVTPDFVHRRAVTQLNPPNSVSMSVKGSTLVVVGEASHEWISRVNFVGPLLPGVTDIDVNQLQDTDLKQFETIRDKLEAVHVEFLSGAYTFLSTEQSKIAEIHQALRALEAQAHVLDVDLTVEVQGFTSPEGSRKVNQDLSKARAEYVFKALPQQTFSRLRLLPVGMGPDLSQSGASNSSSGIVSHGRRVSLHIVDSLQAKK